jgi:hypothetical protein
MSDTPPATYTLALPGSNDTQELSRAELKGKLAQGSITPQHWVWSPDQQDWKQISEIPDLQPEEPAKPGKKNFFGGRVKAAAPAAKTPPAPAPVPQQKMVKRKPARSGGSRRKEEGRGVSLVEAFFALVFAAAAALVAANYVLVDEPLADAMAKTPFVLAPIHAHLNGFVQQDTILIHVIPDPSITADNLADCLFLIAQGTPMQPLASKPFKVVALTPALKGLYAMTGEDWQQFAKMTKATREDRKNFLLDHLDNVVGQPMIPDASKLAPDDLKASRQKLWEMLLASFVPNHSRTT